MILPRLLLSALSVQRLLFRWSHERNRWLWFILIAVWLAVPVASVHGADVRDVLENLSRQYGFALQGAENLAQEESAGEDLPGDLQVRVRQLLHHYNYLVVSADGRGIEKVVIIGAKHGAHLAEPADSVKITRDGMHHRVEALLTGVNGEVLSTTLIVDTGASNVVLPESMMPLLGFKPQELQQASSQTASGQVAVKVAKLPAVAIGQNQASDVAVSFVEDKKIGDLRLLGMSFLCRFTVTIDDQNQRLILVDR